MTNASYLAVSFSLVWLLLVGYVGYLHLRVNRLRERWEHRTAPDGEED